VDRYGPWRDRDISWPGGGGPRYEVMHPVTKQPCKIPDAGWRFSTPEEMQRQIKLGLVVFREDHTQPPFRKAHLLPISEEIENEASDESDAADDDDDQAGMVVMPSFFQKQAQVSIKLLRKIFGKPNVFPNPKDHEILLRLVRYVTESHDIIMDCFAGSGSLGHAVLQINNEDDASRRRFILVEMDENICRDVTAQRLTRVIDGYGDTPGLGGGYRFCTLGEPLFDENGQIRAGVKFPDLAAHIYFTETGTPIPKRSNGRTPFLGVHDGKAVYLLFNGVLGDKSPQGGNVLTGDVLRNLPVHNGPKVIYGESCRLGADRLRRAGIVFKQVPYEIKVS
jgi:adenine-specific DNA-methyltransferase